MDGVSSHDLVSYSDFGLSRRVAISEEHGYFAIPDELLTDKGRLDLYEDVLGKHLFSIDVKGTSLRLRAGSFVGLIPLNDRVSVEVRTRVPISNLERMLSMVEKYNSWALPFQSAYRSAEHRPASVIDLMADELLDAVQGLRDEGLFRGYRQVVRTGTDISGRVYPKESVLRQQRAGRPTAVFSRFERTVDIAVNRCIKTALELLIQLYGSFRNREGGRKRISRLSQALGLFERVEADRSFRFLDDVTVRNPWHIPESRPYLAQAASVSLLIVKSWGVNIRTRGEIRLPTFLINMESVFEGYVRRTIESAYRAHRNVRVLDGNKPRPGGAQGFIFDAGSTGKHGNSGASPDTVIESDGKAVLIIETKYKPQASMPVREELDQVIAYGAAYGCSNVVLAYPCVKGRGETVPLGTVAGITVHMATIELGTSNIGAAEQAFTASMMELAAVPL